MASDYGLPDQFPSEEEVKKRSFASDLLKYQPTQRAPVAIDLGGEVASPTGQPTPYTTMENRDPSGILPPKEEQDIVRELLAQIKENKQRSIVAQAAAGKIYDKSRAEQEQGIGRLQAAADAVGSEGSRTDLSPLLSLTDTWTGSNFTKSYKPPETDIEMAKRKFLAEKELQEGREKLSEFDLERIKNAGMGGGGIADIANLLNIGKRDNRYEGTQLIQGTKKLADDMEKTGLSELESVIENIKSKINLDGEDDIPGAGLTGNAPEIALSQKGQDVRLAVQALQNIVQKARSGLAVTAPEEARMLKELGIGATRTDRQLRVGIKNVIAQLQDKKRNLLAGYNDPIKNQFKAQGGSVKTEYLNSGPAVGTVKDGYRFKGGDQYNEKNWEAVK